jgi:hypothetical protein
MFKSSIQINGRNTIKVSPYPSYLRFIIHGVADLIVADASIIPFTVDGNASAPAFLIGFTIARQLQFLDRKIQRRKKRRLQHENDEE